jgi:hypothetical protein
MRLRVAGTDASGASDYLRSNYAVRTNGNVLNYSSSAGASAFYVGYNFAGENSLSASMDIFNANLAVQTRLTSLSHNSDGTSYFALWTGQAHQVSTAYTGLTIFTASGNVTGSVSVYGYNK